MERLRQRTLPKHGGREADSWAHHWNLTPGDSELHAEAAHEIERLRDVLLRLQQWADAYPVEQFPEPLRQDWQRANALLAERGISMSAMTASNMRHVLNGARQMLAEGLRA